MATKSTTSNASAIFAPAAKAAIGLAALFAVLLTLLHFIEPEFDPSWRFVSEYANGDYGWVQQIVFISTGLSVLALLAAIKSQVKTVIGKIGMGLLVLTSVSLIVAAFFAIDPITSTKDQLTTHGNIHGLTAMVGNSSFGIGALLVGLSLAKNSLWSKSRKAVLLASVFPIVSIVFMLVMLFATLPKDGTFSSSVLIGWPNRIVFLAYSLFPLTLALNALKIRKGR